MTRSFVRRLGLLLALAVATPAAAWACFCANAPFRDLAAKADRVVIGRALDLVRQTDDSIRGEYWVSRITVSRVVRGRASVGEVVMVGTRRAPCNLWPETVSVGREFALALFEKEKERTGLFMLSMCDQTSIIPIGRLGRARGATVEEIEQWARPAKP